MDELTQSPMRRGFFEDLIFYHGTSSRAARGILASGTKDYLGEIGARDFAVELFSLLRKQVQSDFEIADLYHRIGSNNYTIAPTAPIGMARYPGETGLASYGTFYVSLNPYLAVRFAVRNPHGSELLSILADGISALRSSQIPGIEEALAKYPQLAELLNSRDTPVVLAITGLGQEQLAHEDGSRDPAQLRRCAELYREYGGQGGFNINFRAYNISAANILEIYGIPTNPLPKEFEETETYGPIDIGSLKKFMVRPKEWL